MDNSLVVAIGRSVVCSPLHSNRTHSQGASVLGGMGASKNIEIDDFLDKCVLTTSGSHCWKYMMKMLGEAIGADVTLEAAGGEVVMAHRSVLALFSTVLDTMDTCGPVGVVELKDVDVEVLKLFLIVMYSGAECEKVLKDNVVGKYLRRLIKVCYTYEVTHMFPTLSILVKRKLTVENCCEYLSTAIEFDLHDIRAIDISIYITKHFSQVVASDGFMWLARTHPALAVQLVRLEIQKGTAPYWSIAHNDAMRKIFATYKAQRQLGVEGSDHAKTRK